MIVSPFKDVMAGYWHSSLKCPLCVEDGGEGRPKSGAPRQGVWREDQPGREIHPRKVQLQRTLPKRKFALL